MMTKYFRASGLWTLQLVLVAYLALCLFHGFVWSAEMLTADALHPGRVIVALLLALASTVTLPFQQGGLVPQVMANLLLVAVPVALMGFTCRYTVASVRDRFEPHALRKLERWWPVRLTGDAFFVAAGVAALVFAAAFLRSQVAVPMTAFLVDVPVLGIAVASATVLWLLANVAAPLWAQQPVRARALRSARHAHWRGHRPGLSLSNQTRPA